MGGVIAFRFVPRRPRMGRAGRVRVPLQHQVGVYLLSLKQLLATGHGTPDPDDLQISDWQLSKSERRHLPTARARRAACTDESELPVTSHGERNAGRCTSTTESGVRHGR